MAFCPKCGTQNESQALYCQVCGSAIAATAPDSPAVLVTGEETYGGFWKRVVAWLIDGLVVSTGTGILAAVSFGIAFIPAVFLGHWLYEAFMTSSSWQATVGKRALNMVVTDLRGRPLSFAHATGRYFAKWLSAMAFGIGFIMVAFTEKKQGLHDFVAGTLVINQ